MYKPRIQVKQSPVRQTTLAHSHQYGFSAILESSLEVDYFLWRCFEGDFHHFKMQPTLLEYHDLSGKRHKYTADGELIDANNMFYVDEVKYLDESQMPDIKLKHDLIGKAYAIEGKHFRVMTEIEIRVGQRVPNLWTLLPTWAMPCPDRELTQLTDRLAYSEAHIYQLFEDSQALGFAPCLIRRAIGHRLLRCDITLPWEQLILHW